MATLSGLEKMNLERIFGMGSGLVMDFTNNEFDTFVYSSVKKYIWDDKYAYRSGSKANRLRAFWDCEDNSVVGELLLELLGYWKINSKLKQKDLDEHVLYQECLKTANRLTGKKVVEDTTSEEDFLKKSFEEIKVEDLQLDSNLEKIIKQRITEIMHTLSPNDTPLACIFLTGSTLEGILLSIASKYPKMFNCAKASPKDKKTRKVLSFDKWTLSNFIDVSQETGFINIDVYKFSHALRDFRNYIHPYQQSLENFHPDKETAQLCVQTLKAAIVQISKKLKMLSSNGTRT